MNVAAKDVRREIVLEREESHWWEVVKDNNCQNDDHHLEGLFLDRVSLVPSWSRLSQRPQDGNVTEHHEDESGEDHNGESFLKVWNVSYTLGCSIDQSDEPHDTCANRAMPFVL